MKTLILSDIHQEIERVQRILEGSPDCDEYVFLGDWFDTHKKTDGDGASGFKKTCEFLLFLATRHPLRSKFVFLAGNHDAGYIYYNLKRPDYFGNPYFCSGFTKSKARTFQWVFSRNGFRDDFFVSVFKAAHITQGFLLTHAGVHPSFFKKGETREHFADRANNAWLNFRNIAYPDNAIIRSVGYARGGTGQVGGILWLDWHYEFRPSSRVGKQIFGHTSVARPECVREGRKSESWNIDSHGWHAEISDGVVLPVEEQL